MCFGAMGFLGAIKSENPDQLPRGAEMKTDGLGLRGFGFKLPVLHAEPHAAAIDDLIGELTATEVGTWCGSLHPQ